MSWDEGDNEQTRVTDFVRLLEGVPWVSQVERQSRALRVHVSDRAQARHELLSLVAQNGLILSHYEMVRPTLEDVFLRLVNREGIR